MKIKDKLGNLIYEVAGGLQGANLRGANLRGANLQSADLQSANLRGADLIGANLRSADLQSADLRGANLIGANLIGANLIDANLLDANLQSANLRGANLRGANLIGANLQSANLLDANLIGANLQSANLLDANLLDANLLDADLRDTLLRHNELLKIRNYELTIARTRLIPEGNIIGWKKCRRGVLVKLLIPAKARRSNAFGRKCRAELAQVIEIIGSDLGISLYDEAFVYKKGDTVIPESWCENFTQECGGGIHFFITRKEAEDFEL